jgi:hypothetical protein
MPPSSSADGETQPFATFDGWAHREESQGKSLDQLPDEFARLRSEDLAELRGLNLQPEVSGYVDDIPPWG